MVAHGEVTARDEPARLALARDGSGAAAGRPRARRPATARDFARPRSRARSPSGSSRWRRRDAASGGRRTTWRRARRARRDRRRPEHGVAISAGALPIARALAALGERDGSAAASKNFLPAGRGGRGADRLALRREACSHGSTAISSARPTTLARVEDESARARAALRRGMCRARSRASRSRWPVTTRRREVVRARANDRCSSRSAASTRSEALGGRGREVREVREARDGLVRGVHGGDDLLPIALVRAEAAGARRPGRRRPRASRPSLQLASVEPNLQCSLDDRERAAGGREEQVGVRAPEPEGPADAARHEQGSGAVARRATPSPSCRGALRGRDRRSRDAPSARRSPRSPPSSPGSAARSRTGRAARRRSR